MAKFKVGDRVRCTNKYDGVGYTFGKTYEVSRIYEDSFGNKRIGTVFDDYGDDDNGWGEDNFELASTSPIRTVTRREIVPGEYGIVEVGSEAVSGTKIAVNVEYGFTTADELREAAHIFNQLAEVLEENAAADKKEAA